MDQLNWPRFSLFIIVLLVAFNSIGYAGITGTVAGQVTDKDSSRPLPGANVSIANTYLGAATDRDGFFLINNIPAGRYEVKAQMIGYDAVIQKDVVILMDLRTTLRFELKPTVLEMQEVTVSAESPMIQRDVTATTHFITHQEIEQLPVQSFQEILEIQPGVSGGHIRGGRQSEVLYLVDGFPIKDAIEGKVGSELPMSSIIDMTLQTGGFNAEYGNAMSGVVNIITQEGSDKLSGKAEVSAFHYGVQPNPFHDRDVEMDWIGELSAGGPLWKDWMKFYIAADIRQPDTRWKREEYGQRVMIYNSSTSRNINLNGKLTLHPFRSLKVTAQGLVSLWNWVEYNNKWKKNLQAMPDRSKQSYRVSLTAVHTLSPQTFYEVRLSQYNVLKSILGAPSLSQTSIYYENNDPRSWVLSGNFPWWLDHQEIHNSAKFDLTAQVTKHHQIKYGAEVTLYDLYKKSVQRMDIDTYDPKFPQYITYDIEYDYAPVQGSAYLQDKIEYEGMIANIGLRYDFMDPKAERPQLEEKIFGDRSEWIVEHNKTVPASVKQQFSPRFGVALPITANRELHINYGYFFQMPLFDYLYTNSNIDPSEGFSPLGDPDLKPSKTVSYEVSYKHQIGEDMLFDYTLFNKEVSNLVDNNTFLSDVTTSAGQTTGYSRYVNLENVNIWGSEIFFKRRVGKFISGKVSYTYMVAKGTGSENTEKFNWLTKDTKVPISDYYLSWDQRHKLVVNLDFRKEGNWGLNLLWALNSPLPYTRYEGISTIPNGSRMSNVTYVDIRASKDFNLGVPVTIFTEFKNVFDRKNILWVDSYGRPGGILDDPGAYDERYRVLMGIDFRLK
ncbi:TonB-dependent receptor [candidate division KSB1 bacterium]|nr:TonB-dependent receptor [candidate division KSB1 bacterium]